MVTSRVVRKGDACILEIDGRPAMPYGYMSYQPEMANYGELSAMGAKLLFFPVYMGDRGINPESGTKPFYDGFWKGEDEYDFSAADMLYKTVIGNSKPGEVYIIPRVMTEPPSFWEKRHPEALARDYAGASVHQCYSSEIWLKDTVKAMEAFVNWVKASGYDKYTAGIHIAGGHTEEFMRPITHALQMTDYSEASVRAWREFLKNKYDNSIERLRTAWGFDVEDFDCAPVPTPAQRVYTQDGCGYRSRQASDYYRFHSEENARAICRLAGETKRMLGGNSVVGAFYAYCGAERGHTAIDTILDCPDVDFLASPFSYKYGRPAGGDWVIGGPLDSLALHNKLWFMECDVRTHLSKPLSESMPRAVPAGGSYYSSAIWTGPDEETSVFQLKKALGKVASHGGALWWFDMWGGWYRSDAYMRFHSAAARVYEKVLSDFRVSAQIAFICDHSCDEIRTDAPDRTDALHMLAMTGAPIRQFEMSDLDLINPEDYRALILVNVYSMDEGRTRLLDKWMSGGRSVIAINSPAFRAPHTALSQETGGGRVSVYRDHQIYVFDALPEAAAVREALLTAGAHIYSYTGDVIYACDGMVTINAVKGGDKRIYLPYKGRLTDAFSGEKLENCEHFTCFTMDEGETRVFFTEYE